MSLSSRKLADLVPINVSIALALRKVKRRIVSKLARHTPLYGWLLPATPLAVAIERGSAPAAALAIFLPGIGDHPNDFKRHGFFEVLRAQGIAVDCVAVDLHIGYFRAGQAVTRLHADVVLPARNAGYQQILLVGVSLGGLGALLYAKEHGAELAGVVLLAPFLGEGSLIREIERAGGLKDWQPGPAAGNYARKLWRWLKQKPASPPAILGYGGSDTYAPAHRLLAQALGPKHVAVAAGAHEWSTWRALWSEPLARGALAMLQSGGKHIGLDCPASELRMPTSDRRSE